MAYLHFPMRNVYTPVSQKEACLKKRTNQEANAKEKKYVAMRSPAARETKK